jgi:uncharacterized protein (TIGR03437 family)
VQFKEQSAFISAAITPPAIFSISPGLPAIQHSADYSLVTSQNPAQPGETVVIYGTGFGPLATPIPSGAAAPGADSITGPCNVITTNAGQILYAGVTPGFAGLYQLNVQLSSFIAGGTTNVTLQSWACGELNSGFVTSQPVPLYIQ